MLDCRTIFGTEAFFNVLSSNAARRNRRPPQSEPLSVTESQFPSSASGNPPQKLADKNNGPARRDRLGCFTDQRKFETFNAEAGPGCAGVTKYETLFPLVMFYSLTFHYYKYRRNRLDLSRENWKNNISVHKSLI